MPDNEESINGGSSNLISDMAMDQKESSSAPGLVEEPEVKGAEKDQFAKELERTLRETEEQVLGLTGVDSEESGSWQIARNMVGDFAPVPWFVWRL